MINDVRLRWTNKREFTRLLDRLDPAKFERRLQREMRPALSRAAKKLVAVVKLTIRNADAWSPNPNRPLTMLLKQAGMQGQLQDTGAMVASVSSRTDGPYKAYVGLLKGKASPDVIRYSTWVHDGRTIKVTPKMRNLFYALADYTRDMREKGRSNRKLSRRGRELLARMGPTADFKPIGKSTPYITLPKREFLKTAVESQFAKKAVSEHLNYALARALLIRNVARPK